MRPMYETEEWLSLDGILLEKGRRYKIKNLICYEVLKIVDNRGRYPIRTDDLLLVRQEACLVF